MSTTDDERVQTSPPLQPLDFDIGYSDNDNTADHATVLSSNSPGYNKDMRMDMLPNHSEDIEDHNDRINEETVQQVSRLNEELQETRIDVIRLCSAWSKTCADAGVPSKAVDYLHLLMETSEVDPASRNAAYQELEINELSIYIKSMQKTVESQAPGIDQSNELEQLKRENAALLQEFTHLTRSQSDAGAKPCNMRRRGGNEFATLNSGRSIALSKTNSQKIRDLEESLREEREQDEAKEALKNKVRGLRVEKFNFVVGRKSVLTKPLPWATVWKVDDNWDRLTEEEQGMVDHL